MILFVWEDIYYLMIVIIDQHALSVAALHAPVHKPFKINFFLCFTSASYLDLCYYLDK